MKHLKKDSGTNWERLGKKTDAEIDAEIASNPDTIDTDTIFWENARLILPLSKGKQQVTVRYDADIIDFFKSMGKGYQSRMNSILRSYMLAELEHQRHDHPL